MCGRVSPTLLFVALTMCSVLSLIHCEYSFYRYSIMAVAIAAAAVFLVYFICQRPCCRRIMRRHRQIQPISTPAAEQRPVKKTEPVRAHDDTANSPTPSSHIHNDSPPNNTDRIIVSDSVTAPDSETTLVADTCSTTAESEAKNEAPSASEPKRSKTTKSRRKKRSRRQKTATQKARAEVDAEFAGRVKEAQQCIRDFDASTYVTAEEAAAVSFKSRIRTFVVSQSTCK